MNPYIYLVVILAEVIGTTLMKFSGRFYTVMAICWYNYLLLCIILVISSDAGLYTYRDCLLSGQESVLSPISLLSWGFFGQRLTCQPL